MTEPLEPVGYYCDHSDEPHDARTHHDWEWVEGKGLVFMHQPNTISAQIGTQRYLGPDRRGKRCPRAQAVYSTAVVDLMAREIQDLRDELEKYVGQEPTVAEEMAYLNSCLDAVHVVCRDAERNATRWEEPLPVPEWVEIVRKAASGERPVEGDVATLRTRVANLELALDERTRQLNGLLDALSFDEKAVPA